jgi:hypothetical protein
MNSTRRWRSGAFTARVPEDTALLTVAWMLRNGDSESAVGILDAILPFASQLRFAPRSAPPTGERPPTGHVSRRSPKDAREALNDLRAAPDIEVMRTVLLVWNPLCDNFLSLWYPRVSDVGRVDEEPFSDAWTQNAKTLLSQFDSAKKTHGPPPRRNRNLAWLVQATREAVVGPTLASRTNGRLRIAVNGMVQKRGAPGSDSLDALRTFQAGVAKKPSNKAFGVIVSQRLAGVYEDDGLLDPTLYAGPITPAESQQHNISEGRTLPPSIVHVVRSTYSAPLHTLVSENLIPSAEVYASLLPQEVCRIVGSSYVDALLVDSWPPTIQPLRNVASGSYFRTPVGHRHSQVQGGGTSCGRTGQAGPHQPCRSRHSAMARNDYSQPFCLLAVKPRSSC